MDYSSNFFTQGKIEKAIEVSFSEIKELLSRYVHIKGLVWNESELTYVDGYFIVEDIKPNIYEFTREEIESGYHLNEPDTPTSDRLISIKGSDYSNKSDLIDKSLKPKGSVDIEDYLYSHKQLCQLMKKLGCPEPKSITELSKKDYYYDVKLLNQKSNFTLEDAAKVAANIYINGFGGFEPHSPLKNHYMELLSDCIKGTNQHGFKLHTVELWCSHYEEFGERYSKTYKNGTYLKQQAVLDYQLTIISKQEFVRWCEYEGIDTGLTYEPKSFDESIESLKMELNNSEIEVSRLRDLYIKESMNTPSKEVNYPSELQLAIDAFEALCLEQEKPPTIENIKEWLQKESKERGIIHKDGSTRLKGLSDIKLKAISSIIKSQ